MVGEIGVFTEKDDHTAPDFIENAKVKKVLLKSFVFCRLFKGTSRFLPADAANYKKSYRIRKPFRLYFRNGFSFEIILPFLIAYLFFAFRNIPWHRARRPLREAENAVL